MNQPVLLEITPDPTLKQAGAPLVYRHSGWHAELALRFERKNARTVLVSRRHSGPLLVQKPLYPEGEAVCHAIVVHPPGGVAGGDQLRVDIALGPRAHALLTTPGAGKWYKASDRFSSQTLAFTLADAATLEWLPQESIVFDAASARWQTQVSLSRDARYAGWEIFCLGRRASGEQFRSGALRQKTQLRRDGELIWNEYMALRGGDPLLRSPVGMNNASVAATFLIANGAMPVELLERCRALAPDDGADCGVTALPQIFAARYLGHSAQQARRYFERLWIALRPWYAGVPAQALRIWNT